MYMALSTVILVGAAHVTRAEVQSREPTGRPSSSSPHPREVMDGSGTGLRTSSLNRRSPVQAQRMAERSPQHHHRGSKMTKDMGDSSTQRSRIYTIPNVSRAQEHGRGSGSPSTTGTDREVYIFSFSNCRMGFHLAL